MPQTRGGKKTGYTTKSSSQKPKKKQKTVTKNKNKPDTQPPAPPVAAPPPRVSGTESDDDSTLTSAVSDAKGNEILAKLCEMQRRYQTRDRKKQYKMSPTELEVYNYSKKIDFKRQKMLSDKCIETVMERIRKNLKPGELEGVSKKMYDKCADVWDSHHSVFVAKANCDHKTQNQQEVRRMLVDDMLDAEMQAFVVLDPDNIMGFATCTGHVGLEGPALDLYNQCFFYFWNQTVPKFVGQQFFGENIRCMMKGAYCAFVDIDGEELRAVSLTDLGYIVAWFKN